MHSAHDEPTPLTPIPTEWWGTLPFEEALTGQLELIQQIHEQGLPGMIGFCTHPPVLTLGSKSKDSEHQAWQGRKVTVSRGGKVTYHGPEQLMIYPMINLNHESFNKDLNIFLRALEEWIIAALGTLGIATLNKSQFSEQQMTTVDSYKSEIDDKLELTGVWTRTDLKKIASLGIGVRKWVTYQGAAINVLKSENFLQISPCGYRPSVMTSVAQQLQRGDSVQEVSVRGLQEVMLAHMNTFVSKIS